MLSCLFTANFLFAWGEQSHGPTSPCLVILGMLEALLSPALMETVIRWGSCVTAGFPRCQGSRCPTAPPCAAEGERWAKRSTLSTERGTASCLKNSQRVLSPLAAADVKKKTASHRWFCEYFLKQLVCEPWEGLEQQVYAAKLYLVAVLPALLYLCELGFTRWSSQLCWQNCISSPRHFSGSAEQWMPGGVRQHNPKVPRSQSW